MVLKVSHKIKINIYFNENDNQRYKINDYTAGQDWIVLRKNTNIVTQINQNLIMEHINQ